MIFSESKAIYLQIADFVCEQILIGEWAENERILSVRELGERLEVNPNTVLRAYDYLQRYETIANRRGIGYFASGDAILKCQNLRKERFISKSLPAVFQEMELIGINISELNNFYNEYLKNKQNEKENK